MRELKEQFYMRWDEMLVILCMEAGFFLFGQIILAVVINVVREKSCVQLGTLLSLFVPFFVMLFLGIGVLPMHFSIAVCLGAVRKRFVPAFFIVSFLENAVAAGVSYLLFHLENLLFRIIYPGFEIESDMQVIFQLKYLLPACLGAVALNSFFGALFLKMGKLALTVFWVIWIAVCVGGPRLVHFVEIVKSKDTAMGAAFRRFFEFVQGFTESSILAGAVLVSAVLLGISWGMLRRQPAEI